MNQENTNPPPPQTKSQSLAKLSEMLGEDENRVGRILQSVLRLSVKNRACTAEEINAFCIVCAQLQLNPITKEIAGIISQSGQLIPIVMVDGWYKMLNRHPQFDGETHSYEYDEHKKLVSCTVNIYMKDRKYPCSATAVLSECRRNTPTWSTSPHRMLHVRAFSYAVRAAINVGAVYDEDDGERLLHSERRSATPPSTGNASTLEALRAASSAGEPPVRSDAEAEAEAEATYAAQVADETAAPPPPEEYPVPPAPTDDEFSDPVLGDLP